MSRKLDVVLGTIVLLLGGFLFWFYARGRDTRIDAQTASKVLPKSDIEKLVVNPEKHTLSVITANGAETLFLPDRPSSIEVTKAGKVNIVSKPYGTELAPFIGFAYSDEARLALGLNMAYYNRLDAGVAVFPSVSGAFSVRVGPVVGYNVFDNTSLFVGCTTTGSPIGGLILKF